MRKRPWALVILAILHFLAPFGNVAFNAIITGKKVSSYFIYAMSPEYLAANWIMFVAPIVAGVAIYACKKWSFYIYLMALLSLFIFSYSGYMSKAGSISLVPVIFVYLVNIMVVGYFLIPAVRNVYFDRRLRWWEIQARYKCDFKCHYTDNYGKSQAAKIGNISENGCFVKSDELPEDEAIIVIILPFNDCVEMSFEGEVIVHNRVDAIGFGVKFNHSKETRKMAKKLIADLDAKGMKISRLDSRPEDSFSYWVRTLLTTGKGFLPKKENKGS